MQRSVMLRALISPEDARGGLRYVASATVPQRASEHLARASEQRDSSDPRAAHGELQYSCARNKPSSVDLRLIKIIWCTREPDFGDTDVFMKKRMAIVRSVISCARGLINSYELNVAIFSALLNFPWELWQVPFYTNMPSRPHWEAIKVCMRATLGDALITLVCFWIVSLVYRSRMWIRDPHLREILILVSTGIAITALIEWLSTQVWDRWAYSDSMPMIPWVNVGLLPVLQWLIIPPLVVWFVRRQLT